MEDSLAVRACERVAFVWRFVFRLFQSNLCFCVSVRTSMRLSCTQGRGKGGGGVALLFCYSAPQEIQKEVEGPKLSVQRRREAWREVLGLKLRPSKLRGPALRCSPSCVLLLSLGEA